MARRRDDDYEDDDRPRGRRRDADVPLEQCPFCHEFIPADEMGRHQRKHTKLRSDGQMTDHATLPPEERVTGDLAGVPRWYTHAKCGATTGMPEEIIRSYLKNPFMYNSRTFCTGCGDYVAMSTVEWVETGENLQDYMDGLKRKAVREGTAEPNVMPVGCWALLVSIPLVPIGAVVGWFAGRWIGAAIGAAAGALAATTIGYLLTARERAKWERIKNDLMRED